MRFDNTLVRARRGEIYWVDFEAGHTFHEEFGKVRPAVVISRRRGGYIVVPMSSDLSSAGQRTCVLIQPTVGNGLHHDGVAVAHHIRFVAERRLRDRIGRLDRATYERVRRAIDDSL